jgi:hypothetical protein
MENWKLNPGRQAYSSLLYRLSHPDLHFTSLIDFPNPLPEYVRFNASLPADNG